MRKIIIILCLALSGCASSKRVYNLYFLTEYENDSVKVFDKNLCLYDTLLTSDFSTSLSDVLRLKTKNDTLLLHINDLEKKIPLKPFKKRTPYILIRHYGKRLNLIDVKYDSLEPFFW